MAFNCLFKLNLKKNGLAFLMIASSLSPAAAFEMPWKKSPSAAPVEKIEKIIIAVDGLSLNAFKEAQRQGLFKQFPNHAAHIAPFPTMTDISWAKVTHTSAIFGAEGRIKSVEATYFDESTQSIQGDPRDYYRRLAAPKYYMGAFDYYFNPYVEGLMYFPTEEVPKLEVKTVINDLLENKPRKVMTAYIGAVDSLAHTQKNRLFPVIRQIDAELTRLKTALKEKNQNPEIILISDHGNIGRFKEGQDEVELVSVDIADVIESAGFKFVQQLKSSQDVAAPLMALGTWAPIYLKERKNLPTLISAFQKKDWFDLAVYINRNAAADTIMTVVGQEGQAKVQYDKNTKLYYYYPEAGNPLQIPVKFHSTKQKPLALNTQQVLDLTVTGNYPDSLVRIIESASARDFDFPDFILTIKDGHFIKSSLGAFTKMFRTHGSLTKNSTFGVVASSHNKLPSHLRSEEILPNFKIEPAQLFGKTSEHKMQSPEKSLQLAIQNSRTGVETQAKDFSQKRIFQHLTRFVSDTRPYFVVSEIKTFMDAFKFDPMKQPNSNAFSPLNFDMGKFDIQTMISPEDIGALTDAVLTAGSVENLAKDARVQALKEKISSLQGAKTLSLQENQNEISGNGTPDMASILESIKQFVVPTKRVAMKMYQMPHLLEKSIVIQEKTHLTETRDLPFARQWLKKKNEAAASFKALNSLTRKDGETFAQKVLMEAIKEADLEDRIYPTSLSKIYRADLKDITVVYVPGIYNSIFDKEIFSLGLNALADDYGLRVIQAPVVSTCSAEVNGEILKNFLRSDLKSRLQRGHQSPRYLFLSYSKGAVDTLNYFVQDPAFVATYVQGLVSIAAPLHGSSILNKTDLPFALVSTLSEEVTPEICKKEKTAAKSINPSAMQSFWRKNERKLTGLTRYFSVTFESDPEDSHIFMKATKLIAQFDENNDGVVTVSSSKFPKALKAVDLGTIKADHLAGILSSRFNQKSFMKGLVSTLSEMNAADEKANLKWNIQVMLSEANAHPIRERRYFTVNSDFTRITKLPFDYKLTKSENFDIIPVTNTYEVNKEILPKQFDPADNFEPTVKLPDSEIKYDPYTMLDVAKLPDVMAATRVQPATPANRPDGIQINYDHSSTVHFRMDHMFNYESRSPVGMDDNTQSGYATVKYEGDEKWALMKSVKNSIRLTTLAYRFSPQDFPKMDLKLAVTKGVAGADPVKGKTGVDDSAFQVWFTIREGRANGDRTLVDPKNDKVFLFGYYWGDEVQGEKRYAGQIFENWYSDKNIVVATLPHAKQVLLNDASMVGKVQNYQRNLVKDLKAAFPGKNIADLEIVAITLQHDSNDAEDSSEAYFKHLRFLTN